MASELEDHNEGQKDGAHATLLASLSVEWNPFLSTAYKRGFRHADQQQSKNKLQDAPPERQGKQGEPEAQLTNKPDGEEMPWVLALLLAYFTLVFGGIFILLRWIILRPWRVAIVLAIVAGFAFVAYRDEALRNSIAQQAQHRDSARANSAPDVGSHTSPAKGVINGTQSSIDKLPPDPHQITVEGVGPVLLGMTIAQARKSLPGFTFARTTDGEGMALVEVKKQGVLNMVLYAGEESSERPINDDAKLQLIYVYGNKYVTPQGIHPGMPLTEVERKLGKLTKISMSEIESREYAEFSGQPAGFIFQVGLPEIGIAGKYEEGKRETNAYAPTAAVMNISISRSVS